MKYIIKISLFVLLFITIADASIQNNSKVLNTGKKVFEAYCWGCHHQTAVAFGPSFEQIASNRTKEQMLTHIMSPKSDYKQLGYRRTVMPSFSNTIKQDELDLIIDFILSFKKGK